MTTHGGSRPGAGRPPAFKPTPEQLKRVAQLCSGEWMGKEAQWDIEESTELAQYFFTEARKLEQKQKRGDD